MGDFLTLDNLYDFYTNKYKRSVKFNSDKTGKKIFVQVPANFEVAKNENSDDTLLFCKIKLMHSGENLNHSCVTDEALEKAAKTLAYKPILADFITYEEDGQTFTDFTRHAIEIRKDGTINYIEKQIGCFTADAPYFEIEEETNHNFLYGYGAIPRDYTPAASIIERKGGTKISVELAINALEYNASTKVLELTDVVITGATCLGKDPNTLEDINEGMKNARLDIADFSAERNSIFANYDATLIEMQERLAKLETACFNINTSLKEGGTTESMNKFEELCQKYGKVMEDITFEYEGLSDDELEKAFENAFTVNTNENQNPENSVNGNAIPEETPSTTNENFANVDNVPSDENYAKIFSLSHEDIRTALYDLLRVYEDAEHDWYYIVRVYDDYFIYQSEVTDKFFGQKYVKNDDSVAFTEERYELFAEYLTLSEKTELEALRSEYSELKQFKEDYEQKELNEKKKAVLDNEKFSSLTDNESFRELVKNMDKYSLVDLEKEAKVIFADSVESNVPESKPGVMLFAKVGKVKKENRYGNLFSK